MKLRFFQAGTASWFYGVDNVGLYSITGPTDAGTLGIKLTAGKVELTWDSGATLQSADSVLGPWADQAGQSPQQVDPVGAGKFYRLKKKRGLCVSHKSCWPGSLDSPASFFAPGRDVPPQTSDR